MLSLVQKCLFIIFFYFYFYYILIFLYFNIFFLRVRLFYFVFCVFMLPGVRMSNVEAESSYGKEKLRMAVMSFSLENWIRVGIFIYTT